VAPFAGDLKTNDGVSIWGFCVEGEPVEVGLKVETGTVSVSGDKSQEGVLSPIQESKSAVVAEGITKADLDVIATTNETWSRYDLGSYKAGGACNFWGVITPGT
jgi:hypothetical protein